VVAVVSSYAASLGSTSIIVDREREGNGDLGRRHVAKEEVTHGRGMAEAGRGVSWLGCGGGGAWQGRGNGVWPGRDGSRRGAAAAGGKWEHDANVMPLSSMRKTIDRDRICGRERITLCSAVLCGSRHGRVPEAEGGG
jgi:hypothetical protein